MTDINPSMNIKFRFFAIAALTVVYFGAAKVGLLLAVVNNNVSIIWPPAGIALAALLLYGARLWPGVFIGCFAATYSTGAPLLFCFIAAFGSTAEALAGIWLLRRAVDFHISLDRTIDVLSFLLFGVLLSTTVSASIGVSGLCYSGLSTWSEFGGNWLVWWLGDAAGVLVITPLVLTSSNQAKINIPAGKMLETATLFSGVTFFAIFISGGYITSNIAAHLSYLVFPFVIWAALRFGQTGVTATIFLTASVTIYGAAKYYGPFDTRSLNVYLTYLYIFIAASSATGMLLAAIIAERRKADEALRQSEEKYRAVVENSIVGITVSNKAGNYIFTNKMFESMLERRGIDLAKMDPLLIVHPEDQRFMAGRRDSRWSGLPMIEKADFRVINPKGEVFWIEGSGTMIQWQGEPALLNFFYDITDKKRAEEELQTSKENYREIYNAINDSIMIHDVDSGDILEANESTLIMYGYTMEELTKANNLGELMVDEPPYTVELAGEMMKKALESGGHTFEWPSKNRQGDRFWVEVDLKPVVIGGLNRVMAVSRDITERKIAQSEMNQLQAQLQQSRKMEAIGALAGGIAHDFNNILSAIMGYAQLALAKADKDSRQHYHLEQVLAAGNRAADLIKHILSFSRQKEQEKKPVEIASVVKEVLKMLRSTLPSTIEIKTRASVNEGIVLADPTEIYQVLMNLCTNASQAMTDKVGLIEVSIDEVMIDVREIQHYPGLQPGGFVRLCISDNGSGIKPDLLDRIFEPYFTTKEIGQGTGLGLATVHGIVKSHGGMVNVYSEQGHGTTFNVYLPAIEADTGAGAEMEAVIPGGSERILMVDDEISVLNSGKEMLESLGYSVDSRISSLEALESFRKAPFKYDLVITDQTMPKMTGMELARELIRMQPNIPIILCTGFAAGLDEDKARDSGIRELLMKPVLLRQMADTVRKVLDG